jgi:hypothetical protein
MRLTIIHEENNKMMVGIDGCFYLNLDATGLTDDIHAIQWYGDHGELEKKDTVTGKMVANEEISSVEDFQFAIDAWNAAYQAEQEALLAEAQQQESATQEESAP